MKNKLNVCEMKPLKRSCMSIDVINQIRIDVETSSCSCIIFICTKTDFTY